MVEGDNGFLKGLNPEFVARDMVDDTYVKKAVTAIGGLSRFGEIDLTRPWDREEVIDI